MASGGAGETPPPGVAAEGSEPAVPERAGEEARERPAGGARITASSSVLMLCSMS